MKFNTALQESAQVIYGIVDHVVKSVKNLTLCDLKVKRS